MPPLPDLRVQLETLDNDEFLALCQDQFGDVYRKFTPGMTRPEWIRLLLEHVERRGEGERLREAIEEKNRRAGGGSTSAEGSRDRENVLVWCREVVERFRLVRILKIPQRKEQPDPPLRDLYVEQAIADRWVQPEESPKFWPATKPVAEAYRENRRLVVLGDPGGGKSTLVAWIAWQLAADALEQSLPPGSWPDRLGRDPLGPVLPLPFILRDLGVERLGDAFTWDHFWNAFLDRAAQPLRALDWRDHFEAGRAFFLLDGLDEIGSVRVRRSLKAAVWEGMRRYPRCFWLLTSRVVGYEDVPFHLEPDLWGLSESQPELDLQTLRESLPTPPVSRRYLVPFDDERVERFAAQWYGCRYDSATQARQAADELVRAVRRDEGTRSLGRTPYLLTLMALIHKETAHLPHGRVLLYNEIANLFLQTIDDSRKLQARKESMEAKRQWLAHVGFRMQCRRAQAELDAMEDTTLLAGADEVRDWIAEAMDPANPVSCRDEAAECVEYLAARTGLLLPRGEGVFGFVHLSFLEYFAACFLEHALGSRAWSQGDWAKVPTGARRDDLRAAAGNPLWQPTLLFLVELVAQGKHPEYREDLFNALFGEGFAEVGEAGEGGYRLPGYLAWLRPLVRVWGWLFGPGLREERVERGVLLANIIQDPYAGWDERAGWTDPLRCQALECCCRAEAQAQIREQKQLWKHRPRIAQALLAGEADQEAVLRALARAAQQAHLHHFSLAHTGMTDLGPLRQLSSLQTLHLKSTGVTDLGPLRQLASLQVLSLAHTGVTDLGPLQQLSSLQVLSLAHTGVTDLGPLRHLSSPQGLSLNNTGVTDLDPLRHLSSLQWLHLDDTGVTDLGPLRQLASLRELCLQNTGISQEQIDQLRTALPSCNIVH
jgi:hypothetical protein